MIWDRHEAGFWYGSYGGRRIAEVHSDGILGHLLLLDSNRGFYYAATNERALIANAQELIEQEGYID